MATVAARTQQVIDAANADGLTFVQLMYRMLDHNLTDAQLLKFVRRIAKRHHSRVDPVRWYDVVEGLIPPSHNDGVRRIPPWTNKGVTPRRGLVETANGQPLPEWLEQDGVTLKAGVALVGITSDTHALHVDPQSDYYQEIDGT